MTKQIEVLFFVPAPEGKTGWSGSMARKALSHLGGDTLPLALFHKNEDGSHKQNRSMIRWGGGRKCFRLVGIGQHAIGVVQHSAVTIARHLSNGDTRPVRVDVRQSPVDLAFNASPLTYIARNVVFSKSRSESRRFWGDLDDRLRRKELRKTVLNSLAAQIEMIQAAGDESFLPDIDEHFESLLAIEVLEFGDPRLAAVGADRFADTVDVRFQARMKLQGLWSVGLMSHLGLGFIEPVDARGNDIVWRSPESPGSPTHPIEIRKKYGAAA